MQYDAATPVVREAAGTIDAVCSRWVHREEWSMCFSRDSFQGVRKERSDEPMAPTSEFTERIWGNLEPDPQLKPHGPGLPPEPPLKERNRM